MNSGALRSAWQLCSLSLRLLEFLLSAAEVSSRARFSAIYGSACIRCEKEASKENGGKRGSRVYPMRVLGGGRMLTEQVRWDKTGCLRL